MLKQISRAEKTRNTVILIFVILLLVSLVGSMFVANSLNNPASAMVSRSSDTLATVGGETITLGEVATQQENMARQFGGQYTPPPKTVLNREIGSRITRLEANRLGLNATDSEVAAEICRSLKQQSVDCKDVEKYRRLITENVGSVEKFEQSVRDGLASDKVRAFLTSGVAVSETEVLDTYKRDKTTFDVAYVPVTPQLLAAKIQPSDDEIRAHFEKNKVPYFISTPQKKIRYLFINQTKVGEKLDIPDADLQAEYNALPDDKKKQGVNAQQIVLKVTNPEQEEIVSAKAAELVTQARKDGGKISEEAFGDLAKGNSQDGSAQSGGKLKGLVRENPNNPTDPLQSILKIEEGQVTEPVKFGESYYIFRRGASVPKSFEDAKPELLVSLRNRRAYKAASDLAAKAVAKVKESKDIAKVAEELAGEANMNKADMVRETGFLKPGDDVPNVGISPQFETGIEPLKEAGDVGETTPIKDGFAIPLLVERKEPRDSEFDEVKDRVAAELKNELAKTRMEEIAKEIANGANTPDALKAAAEKYGLTVKDAKDYKVGSPLTDVATGGGDALEDAIYNLKPNEVGKTPVKTTDGFVVVAASKRTDANLEEFAKERDTLVNSAVQLKQGQIFNDHIASLRTKMEKDGRIKIYQDALAKLDPAKKTEIDLES